MGFATKKAFTMMELVVIMFLLTVGFFSIISMLNSGMRFTQIIKAKIIATNLAREGVESMYQIRDTNRRRWSSKRDMCWLKTNPLLDEVDWFSGWSGCENLDELLWSGNYVILNNMIWNQKYFTAKRIIWSDLNIKDWIQSWDLNYSLCFWSWEWYTCPWIRYTSWEGRFFRKIIGKWLFSKDSNTAGGDYLNCTYGSEVVWTQDCGDGSAKEYRFCSKVEYENGRWISDVEICSLMTNYLE